MTEQRVLAAAAALRQFNLDEIAASCDEMPPRIVQILDALPHAVQRVEPGSGPGHEQRWQVVDRTELRRLLGAPARSAVPAGPVEADERLRHAEETLIKCGAEPSDPRRQALVGTAVNYLRQAVAADQRLPWWEVELGPRFEEQLPDHADPATAARLRLNVTVARLALGDAASRPVSTTDLLDRVGQFRSAAQLLCGEERLRELVRGFVDLATARLAAGHGAVERLVIAVARRRVRAQVGSDLDGALRALEPLVREGDALRAGDHDLYRVLGRLPDGRNHAVVYADLLSLLPTRLSWQHGREWLPGTLVEVTAEPVVADHLSRYARQLESDLRNSPFQSDKALIGQAAHVFQTLSAQLPADPLAPAEGQPCARSVRTQGELITLATTPVWPAPASKRGRTTSEPSS